MNIDLSGKTALVTGSTAGIGHAIAKGLAGSGASVVINGRSQDKVDAAVRKLEAAGAKVRGIAADVSTASGCKRFNKAGSGWYGCEQNVQFFRIKRSPSTPLILEASRNGSMSILINRAKTPAVLPL